MDWNVRDSEYFEFATVKDDDMKKNPFTDPNCNRNNFPDLSSILHSNISEIPSEESDFQDAKSFNWSIEHISLMAPADIEFKPQEDSHFLSNLGSSNDFDTQRVIDEYFRNVVLPSPWTPNNSDSSKSGDVSRFMSSHKRIENASPSSVRRCDAKLIKFDNANIDSASKYNNRKSKNVVCQTNITIPPNVDLIQILVQHQLYSQESVNSRQFVDFSNFSNNRFTNKAYSHTPRNKENLIHYYKNIGGNSNRILRSSPIPVFFESCSQEEKKKLQNQTDLTSITTDSEKFYSALSPQDSIESESNPQNIKNSTISHFHTSEKFRISPLTQGITFDPEVSSVSSCEVKSGMISSVVDSSFAPNSNSVFCGTGLSAQISDDFFEGRNDANHVVHSFLSSTTAISPIGPMNNKISQSKPQISNPSYPLPEISPFSSPSIV